MELLHRGPTEGLLKFHGMGCDVYGRSNITTPAFAFASGGAVVAGGSSCGGEERPQELSIVNVIDPQLMERYMASSAGQKMLVNVLAANAYQVRKVIFQ